MLLFLDSIKSRGPPSVTRLTPRDTFPRKGGRSKKDSSLHFLLAFPLAGGRWTPSTSLGGRKGGRSST